MDLWLILVIPILVVVGPHLIRYIASLHLSYRKRGEKSALQTQIIEYRRELSKINQVDEFAKYSKIKRKLTATSDELNSISRQDLEIKFTYVLVGQGLVLLVAVIFSFRLVHQFYAAALDYLGYYSRIDYY